MNFRTERTKPLAQLTAYDVPRGLDPDDVATDETESSPAPAEKCPKCSHYAHTPGHCEFSVGTMDTGCECGAGAAQSADNHDECIVCGKVIPPGPDFCSDGCEKRAGASTGGTQPGGEAVDEVAAMRLGEPVSKKRGAYLSECGEASKQAENRSSGVERTPPTQPVLIREWRMTLEDGIALPLSQLQVLQYIDASAGSVPDAPQGWLYEDELPEGYPYDAMWPYSKVDGVRLFPRLPERQEGIVHEKSSNDIFMRDLVHYLCTGKASSTLKEGIANFVASSSSYPQLFGPAEPDHKSIRSAKGHGRN